MGGKRTTTYSNKTLTIPKKSYVTFDDESRREIQEMLKKNVNLTVRETKVKMKIELLCL